ncbi:MAG: hypothetical protein RR812_06955 [Vagococcus sp.]
MDKPKNRFDELLENFELSKAKMTNEQLQGFAKAVLKYASSNEEANKYIDQLLDDILETEVEKPKFEAGLYYSFKDNGSKEIFKVLQVKEYEMEVRTYDTKIDMFKVFSTPVKGNSTAVSNAKIATFEETKLFKRAAMYHKHKRGLDELKIGDLLIDKTESDTFQLENVDPDSSWIKGINLNAELYLTVEEQQEAHKKIVGG